MTMNLGAIPPLDLAMLGLLVLAWLLSGWFSEHPPAMRPSVSWAMEEYRRDWMRTFVTRQPFVTSNIIGATSLEQLESNLGSLSLELSDELLDAIEAIHREQPNPAP